MDEWLNFMEMKVCRLSAGPPSTDVYRPALLLKSGIVLWHPRAMIHADVISLNFDVSTFDWDSIVGTGGLDQGGTYWQSDYIGDYREE